MDRQLLRQYLIANDSVISANIKLLVIIIFSKQWRSTIT